MAGRRHPDVGQPLHPAHPPPLPRHQILPRDARALGPRRQAVLGSKSMNWLITGVSSGLGRAIAAAALARGDKVAGTVRRQTDLDEFEAQAPGRAFGYLADMVDEGAVRAAVDRA